MGRGWQGWIGLGVDLGGGLTAVCYTLLVQPCFRVIIISVLGIVSSWQKRPLNLKDYLLKHAHHRKMVSNRRSLTATSLMSVSENVETCSRVITSECRGDCLYLENEDTHLTVHLGMFIY